MCRHAHGYGRLQVKSFSNNRSDQNLTVYVHLGGSRRPLFSLGEIVIVRFLVVFSPQGDQWLLVSTNQQQQGKEKKECRHARLREHTNSRQIRDTLCLRMSTGPLPIHQQNPKQLKEKKNVFTVMLGMLME